MARGPSGWHVGYYNASGRALSMAQAAPLDGGVASLNFTNQTNTALLIATSGASPLLGADFGQIITADFTISGADASDFTFYGAGGLLGSGSATARLFLQTTNAGGFAYTNYWWADVAFVNLGNGLFHLTAKIAPDALQWSDWNGQSAFDNAGAFTAAANNITGIGLSFGGGYFFENGVGTSNGSGTLALTNFSLS